MSDLVPRSRDSEYFPPDDFSWIESVDSGALAVRRIESSSSVGGPSVSALQWGGGPSETLFVHGGGQNAHTWDLVISLLGLSALAIDLPGHGLSSWRADADYGPDRNARAVFAAASAATADSVAVVGMSLGGLTSIALAAHHPEWVSRLVLVDILPGVSRATRTMGAPDPVELLSGRRSFADFGELLRNVRSTAPGRPEDVLRRGALHNSKQLVDGRWSWRYDDLGRGRERRAAESAALWDTLGTLTMPVMLVLGGDSRLVDPAAVERLGRVNPAVRIVTVAGAGHSVQGDRPTELAAVLDQFLRPR